MKLLTLALVMLAVTAMGQTNDSKVIYWSPTQSNECIETNWSKIIPTTKITSAVRDLAVSGDICGVLRHQWRECPYEEIWDIVPPGVHSPQDFQKCAICGKREVRTYVPKIIHIDAIPYNPVVGQKYRFGKDPNTHTYLGGGCWSSTLMHWTE